MENQAPRIIEEAGSLFAPGAVNAPRASGQDEGVSFVRRLFGITPAAGNKAGTPGMSNSSFLGKATHANTPTPAATAATAAATATTAAAAHKPSLHGTSQGRVLKHTAPGATRTPSGPGNRSAAGVNKGCGPGGGLATAGPAASSGATTTMTTLAGAAAAAAPATATPAAPIRQRPNAPHKRREQHVHAALLLQSPDTALYPPGQGVPETPTRSTRTATPAWRNNNNAVGSTARTVALNTGTVTSAAATVTGIAGGRLQGGHEGGGSAFAAAAAAAADLAQVAGAVAMGAATGPPTTPVSGMHPLHFVFSSMPPRSPPQAVTMARVGGQGGTHCDALVATTATYGAAAAAAAAGAAAHGGVGVGSVHTPCAHAHQQQHQQHQLEVQSTLALLPPLFKPGVTPVKTAAGAHSRAGLDVASTLAAELSEPLLSAALRRVNSTGGLSAAATATGTGPLEPEGEARGGRLARLLRDRSSSGELNGPLDMNGSTTMSACTCVPCSHEGSGGVTATADPGVAGGAHGPMQLPHGLHGLHGGPSAAVLAPHVMGATPRKRNSRPHLHQQAGSWAGTPHNPDASGAGACATHNLTGAPHAGSPPPLQVGHPSPTSPTAPHTTASAAAAAGTDVLASPQPQPGPLCNLLRLQGASDSGLRPMAPALKAAASAPASSPASAKPKAVRKLAWTAAVSTAGPYGGSSPGGAPARGGQPPAAKRVRTNDLSSHPSSAQTLAVGAAQPLPSSRGGAAYVGGSSHGVGPQGATPQGSSSHAHGMDQGSSQGGSHGVSRGAGGCSSQGGPGASNGDGSHSVVRAGRPRRGPTPAAAAVARALFASGGGGGGGSGRGGRSQARGRARGLFGAPATGLPFTTSNEGGSGVEELEVVEEDRVGMAAAMTARGVGRQAPLLADPLHEMSLLGSFYGPAASGRS